MARNPIYRHTLRLRDADVSANGPTIVNILNTAWADRWWGQLRLIDNVSQTIGTSVQALGMAITTANFGTGAATVNDTLHGRYMEYTSAAAATGRAGWFSTNGVTRRRNMPLFFANARLSATLTAQRNWVGLSSSVVSTGGLGDTDTPGTTNGLHTILFRRSSVAADANWMIVSSDGASETVVDSGVAATASTAYRFRIDAATPASVTCYINDTLVATVTLTLPGIDTNLNVVSALYNTTASGRVYGVKTIDVYEQIR